MCLFFLSFMFGGSSVWTQCHVFPTQWSTTSATPPVLLGFRYFIQIGSYFWMGWVMHWDTPTDTSNAAEILDASQHACLYLLKCVFTHNKCYCHYTGNIIFYICFLFVILLYINQTCFLYCIYPDFKNLIHNHRCYDTYVILIKQW
jgi:hypothetical protein